MPNNPTHVDGYSFDGWYTAPIGGTLITSEYVFNSDTTVYAHWVNDNVNVTGVILDHSSLALRIGETAMLKAIVSPDNVTNKSVIWESSDSSVATVSDNGLITAVSEGTVTITVTTIDGQKTASCVVTVQAILDHEVSGDSSIYIPEQEPEYRWVRFQNGFRLYYGNTRVTGWYQDQNTDAWYWLDTSSGLMAADQWVEINGVWYWFRQDGVMQTGWIEYDNNWYYLKDWGGMATGWQYIDNVWYYFKDWGGMVTGWQYINGNWYYFRGSGAMVASAWVETNGKWYYLTGSGAMAADRWVEWKGEWYYLYSSGAMATNATIDGYYVNASGAWVQ